jgi:hypothetical protein
MQDTCKIHACFSCTLHVICKSWCYITMYMHVYVYMTFIRACIFGGSSYVPVLVRICMYMHVYACIWDTCLYLNPLQTEICWNAYMHVLVWIRMYHMYMYIYACIGMYLYVYKCMCIYMHLCRLFAIYMFISACTCQAAVAPGSGSKLFYINLWAMIWPMDYPADGCWSNKWVDLNRIQACDTSRVCLEVDSIIYRHIQTDTDRYRQIHALPIHAHINTFPIHAHINTSYMPVYVCNIAAIIEFPHDFLATCADACICMYFGCICLFMYVWLNI